LARPIALGDIVVAKFPEHRPSGREQQGLRPALVMGFPERLGLPRFPVILLAPLTTDHGQVWALQSPRLYPNLAAGLGGLPSASIVLLDQTRFLSAERISRWLGALPSELWEELRERLVELSSPLS